jgi:hypothetical protein
MPVLLWLRLHFQTNEQPFYLTWSSSLSMDEVGTLSKDKQRYDKCITYTTTSVNYSFLTYSTKQSPTWEANRGLTSPEIPHILWNLKAYYPIHKYPPPVPILSNINTIHDLTSHFLKINFNVIFPSTLGSSQLLSCRFLDHTQRRATVGRTPLEEWLARRRDLYQTAHNTHNRK